MDAHGAGFHTNALKCLVDQNKLFSLQLPVEHISPHTLFTSFYPDNVAHPRWRLVNGSTPAEGRLDYQLDNGDWACVCSRVCSLFSYPNVHHDLCRLLGFGRAMAFYKFSSSLLFGRCSGPVYCLKYGSDSMISAVPIPSTAIYPECDESGTIGLRCIKSKFISTNLSFKGSQLDTFSL